MTRVLCNDSGGSPLGENKTVKTLGLEKEQSACICTEIKLINQTSNIIISKTYEDGVLSIGPGALQHHPADTSSGFQLDSFHPRQRLAVMVPTK